VLTPQNYNSEQTSPFIEFADMETKLELDAKVYDTKNSLLLSKVFSDYNRQKLFSKKVQLPLNIVLSKVTNEFIADYFSSDKVQMTPATAKIDNFIINADDLLKEINPSIANQRNQGGYLHIGIKTLPDPSKFLKQLVLSSETGVRIKFLVRVDGKQICSFFPFDIYASRMSDIKDDSFKFRTVQVPLEIALPPGNHTIEVFIYRSAHEKVKASPLPTLYKVKATETKVADVEMCDLDYQMFFNYFSDENYANLFYNRHFRLINQSINIYDGKVSTIEFELISMGKGSYIEQRGSGGTWGASDVKITENSKQKTTE